MVRSSAYFNLTNFQVRFSKKISGCGTTGFSRGSKRAFGPTVSISNVWTMGRWHQSWKLLQFHLLVLIKMILAKHAAPEKKRFESQPDFRMKKQVSTKVGGFLLLYFVGINLQGERLRTYFFRSSTINEWCLCFGISRTFKGLYESVWLYNCCCILQAPWRHLGASATSGPFNRNIVIYFILTPILDLLHFDFLPGLKPAGATRAWPTKEIVWHNDPSQKFDGQFLGSMARCRYGVCSAIS